MQKSVCVKKCHICRKALSRSFENLFLHCFECDLKRLELLTFDHEPCKICKKCKTDSEINRVKELGEILC